MFEFATKYPSLRTQPLEPIGENLKAALEREAEKDEEEEREREREREREGEREEAADLGLIKERN